MRMSLFVVAFCILVRGLIFFFVNNKEFQNKRQYPVCCLYKSFLCWMIIYFSFIVCSNISIISVCELEKMQLILIFLSNLILCCWYRPKFRYGKQEDANALQMGSILFSFGMTRCNVIWFFVILQCSPFSMQMRKVLIPYFMSLCVTASVHSLEGTLLVCLLKLYYLSFVK